MFAKDAYEVDSLGVEIGDEVPEYVALGRLDQDCTLADGELWRC